jgi:sec-independent protein translocase protein TatA
MLGLDNPIHIAFVLVLLLLVFGAKRLPEMGKSMGEGLRGFKEAISTDGGVEARLNAAHASVLADEARAHEVPTGTPTSGTPVA